VLLHIVSACDVHHAAAAIIVAAAVAIIIDNAAAIIADPLCFAEARQPSSPTPNKTPTEVLVELDF
jgi:hypothetical protein